MLSKVMRPLLESELLWKLKSLLVHRRVVWGNPYFPQEPSSMMKLVARLCMISGLVTFGSKFLDAMLLETTQRSLEQHDAMCRSVGIVPGASARATEENAEYAVYEVGVDDREGSHEEI